MAPSTAVIELTTIDMTRRPLVSIPAAALAIAGAALASAAILAVAARGRDAAIVRSVENGGDWYARSPGWFTTRGLFPTEHAPDGSAFAWAGGRVRVQIPRLDRRGSYTLGLRARSGRATSEPPALVRVAVDGLEMNPVSLGSEWEEISIALPPASREGATILIETERTFTPGPQDARALAFMIDRLTLAGSGTRILPSRGVLDRRGSLRRRGRAGGRGLPDRICDRIRIWPGCGRHRRVAAALRLGVSRDLQPSARTPGGGGRRLAAVLASALARALANGVRGWRVAALAAIVVTSLRLAVFVHPDAPVSDGMFHVHRAEAVREGNYIFTSVTPEPFYEFPYPVGLYVAAQPLWDRFTDRVALLRGITLVFDAFVALGLFAVVSGRWGERVGLLALALALAFPVVTQSVATANLTNVFAQSCFSLAVLWIAWHLTSTRAIVATIGAVLLLSAAFLSHFSTAVIGVPAAGLAAVAVALAREPRERAAWRWIALSVVLALAISYVVYYSHFHEVYARTLSRVGTERAGTSLVATLSEHSESKALTTLRFLASNYGWPALALSAAGLVAALGRGWRDGWSLVLFALSTTVAAFLALGAFTPIEMRASLAAQPLVAAFAALGCAWLWQSDRSWLKALVVGLLAATLWLALTSMRTVLG